VTRRSSQEIRAEYDRYIERAREQGVRVISYTAPCCGQELDSVAPRDPEVVWDSLHACPNCDRMGVKITRRDSVEIRFPEELAS